jgi:hypothetical protein
MAEEMTLVSKRKYEQLIQELEQLKTERISAEKNPESGEIPTENSEKNKEINEKPHYFVENSFQQLFQDKVSKLKHPPEVVNAMRSGQPRTHYLDRKQQSQGQSIKHLARKTRGRNIKPTTQKIVQGRTKKVKLDHQGDVKRQLSQNRQEQTNHSKWVNYLV